MPEDHRESDLESETEPEPPAHRRPYRLDVADVLVVSLVALVTGVLLVLGGTTSDSSEGVRHRDSCDPRADSVAERVDDVGFSEGAGLASRSDADLDRGLAGMAATGARYLRLDFDWSYLERRRGHLDWTPVDRVVAGARDCGLEVLGLLAYTPTWARPPGTGTHAPPADPADFAAFAAEAVRRYQPQGIGTWEVWNEPNLGHFWEPAPDPAAYADLLIATYQAIKAVDPDATVITGGLAPAPDAADGAQVSPLTFLEELYAAGAGGHFDAVGHHPYSYPSLPLTGGIDAGNDNAFAGVTPRLHAVMDAHGDGDKLIWGTEMGAPTGVNLTAVFLAEYIVEAYEGWRAWPFTGPLIWYSYRDAGTDPTDREDNFGLVRTDYTPKQPALSAFEAVIRR